MDKEKNGKRDVIGLDRRTFLATASSPLLFTATSRQASNSASAKKSSELTTATDFSRSFCHDIYGLRDEDYLRLKILTASLNPI